MIDQISKINPDCSWAFVTNANYKFNEAISSRLDKIKIRWIQISMDSISEKVYEEIRIRGSFQKNQETFEAFLKFRDARHKAGRPIQIMTSMCVLQNNWQELNKFIAFSYSKDALPILQYAYKPEHLSLSSLPKEKREEILKYFSELREIYGAKLLDSIYLPLKDSLSGNSVEVQMIL